MHTRQTRTIPHRLLNLGLIATLSFAPAGCTTDGRVRYVDGGYQKVYADPKGGYYYVNRHAEKVHLDELPPEHAPDMGDGPDIP